MLLGIRSFVEAGRALVGWTALLLDRARFHPDAQERARCDDLVALLTPVVKASFTDLGFESAVQAQQVFGGHGYVREWGVEQYVRDARIAQIYEGTNGVQAMDLVGHKLGLGAGRVVEGFLDLVADDLADGNSGTAPIVKGTRDALALLRQATATLHDASLEERGAVAVDYLRLFALVALGWMWSRMATAAGGETEFARAKRSLADFFARRMLPNAQALAAAVASGDEAITNFPQGRVLSRRGPNSDQPAQRGPSRQTASRGCY